MRAKAHYLLVTDHDWLQLVVSFCQNKKDFFDSTYWIDQYPAQCESPRNSVNI